MSERIQFHGSDSSAIEGWTRGTNGSRQPGLFTTFRRDHRNASCHRLARWMHVWCSCRQCCIWDSDSDQTETTRSEQDPPGCSLGSPFSELGTVGPIFKIGSTSVAQLRTVPTIVRGRLRQCFAVTLGMRLHRPRGTRSVGREELARQG